MGGFGAAQWRFGPTGLGPAMPEQGSGQVRDTHLSGRFLKSSVACRTVQIAALKLDVAAKCYRVADVFRFTDLAQSYI